MSIIYCDYCNTSASANEWDGTLAHTGENVCSQCEFDGVIDSIAQGEYQEWVQGYRESLACDR